MSRERANPRLEPPEASLRSVLCQILGFPPCYTFSGKVVASIYSRVCAAAGADETDLIESKAISFPVMRWGEYRWAAVSCSRGSGYYSSPGYRVHRVQFLSTRSCVTLSLSFPTPTCQPERLSLMTCPCFGESLTDSDFPGWTGLYSCVP